MKAFRFVPSRGVVLPVFCASLHLAAHSHAVPSVEETPSHLRVTGAGYRLTVQRYESEFDLELRDEKDAWRRVAKKTGRPELGLVEAGTIWTTPGKLARLAHSVKARCVVIGLTTALSAEPERIAVMHLLCADEGVLMRFVPAGPGVAAEAVTWAMPRWPLDESMFDGYAFWKESGEFHTGTVASLGERDAYAGVSAWGKRGDTATGLSACHPALIAQARAEGIGLGVVFVRYAEDWAGSHAFIQRHTPQNLYFYSALAPATEPDGGRWAWLAPFAESDPAQLSAQVDHLLILGERLRQDFRSVAPEPDPAWTAPVPDFPAELRGSEPVKDIREAVVYTVHETMDSDDGIRAGAKAGSDVWIRAWFKWNQARDYQPMAHLVPKAHALGALFGGGITCSALYHGENGLTEAQVLDMATRGPDGRLVDAWDEAGCRHGSLSNPAYLEYLLSWCRQQIDAGVDYLFMDEINAALQSGEGFDDYSIRDFRDHLLRIYCEGKGWARDDLRWRKTFRVDPADRALCPDGTMASFDYRTFLRKQGLVANPHGPANPLGSDWHVFRRDRDDRSWKWLTDAIRAYAAGKGRRVLISGNGLARYVDLQVLGVWGLWRVRDGAVDLAESQMDEWASTVAAGRSLAGARVPVVFFHDWGFNGFPWMEVPPPERALWMRVRGAEIYAAGGFFAFPVHGPMNNDALRDGTIAEVARQTAFYRKQKSLYLGARFLGLEPLDASAPLLSTALWSRENASSLILHVINRQAANGQPVSRTNVQVKIPADREPKAVRIVSPDWSGEQPGAARVADGRLIVTLPRLDAYALAILDYDVLPEVRMSSVKTVPAARWDRPERNEFIVEPGGAVRDAAMLTAFLHGNLHAALRDPPVFLVAMPEGGKLRVHVRAVATLGARIECLIDGGVMQTADLPDMDRKNDSGAREYDRTLEFDIPPGRHRVTLRNRGGDWASVAWYAFEGEIAGW